MNERIQELLKQASKLANTEDTKDFDRNFDMIVAEKFAELIVRECAERFEEYWNDAGWQRMYNPTEYVNEHFGIEP